MRWDEGVRKTQERGWPHLCGAWCGPWCGRWCDVAGNCGAARLAVLHFL